MWTISVPVWGPDYFLTFERVLAPSILAATEPFRQKEIPYRFILHTDQPSDRVTRALPGHAVEMRPVPRKSTYVTLQESHADAVASAAVGDKVVLLNADLAVSGNLMTRCSELFEEDYQAVVLLGIRTAAGREPPPTGLAPRDLLIWAWDNRHQIIRDLEWPAGGSLIPTNLFFTSEENTVARGFHLHPVAIVKQVDTKFHSTIDGDLLDCFPRDKVHVVTDPDDCAMCEVSPPERRFPVRQGGLSPARVAASMRTRATATHRWLFEFRIVVRGDGEKVIDDVAVVTDIMREMARPAPPETRRNPYRRDRGRTPAGRRGRLPGVT